MAVHEGGAGGSPVQVVDHAEQTDDRSGIDVGAGRLVVEADVAADHRSTEGLTSLRQSVDGFRQLPHDLGMFGVTEVETVHDSQRAGAHTGQVQHRFGDHSGRATTGIHGTPPVVAVGGHGQSPSGLGSRGGVAKLQHRSVISRADHRIQEELVVVLAVHPGWTDQQVEQVVPRVDRRGKPVGHRAPRLGRSGARSVVEGSILMERGGRHVSQYLAVEAVQNA